MNNIFYIKDIIYYYDESLYEVLRGEVEGIREFNLLNNICIELYIRNDDGRFNKVFAEYCAKDLILLKDKINKLVNKNINKENLRLNKFNQALNNYKRYNNE